MTKILIQVLCVIIAYFVVYGIYLITVINKPKKLKKFQNGTELTLLKRKYKIEVKEEEQKKVAKMIARTNALIIAVTFGIVTYFKNMWLSLILGFIIMIILILIMYTIIGKRMVKLGVK